MPVPVWRRSLPSEYRLTMTMNLRPDASEFVILLPLRHITDTSCINGKCGTVRSGDVGKGIVKYTGIFPVLPVLQMSGRNWNCCFQCGYFYAAVSRCIHMCTNSSGEILNTLLWIYTVSLAVLSRPLPSYVNPRLQDPGRLNWLLLSFLRKWNPQRYSYGSLHYWSIHLNEMCRCIGHTGKCDPFDQMFFVCPIRIAAFPPNSLSKTTFPLPIILMSWTPLYP